MGTTVKFIGGDRVDRRVALLLFVFFLAIYLRTLAPDMLPGDPGEFHFAAWRFGLAHPTGYPLYLLIGGLWQRALALFGVNPAAALNAMSAFWGALAVALLYLLTRRFLLGPSSVQRVTGVLAAMVLATNPTFWSQNLIAEVYTLHALFILLILHLVLACTAAYGVDEAPAARPWWPAVALAATCGLALAHHGMTMLFLLVVGLYLLYTGSWRRIPTAAWPLMALALLLPLLLYLYIPLRSGPDASPWYHQPLGDATLSLYANNWAGFVQFVSGRSISVGFKGLGEAVTGVGIAAWLWHYHFGWAGLVLVLLGLFTLTRRRQWALLLLTGGYALLQQLFNLFYNIGDILVYYIPLYLLAALWLAIGVEGLATGIWRRNRAAGAVPLAEEETVPPPAEAGDVPPPAEAGDAPVLTARATEFLGILVAASVLLFMLSDAPVTYAQLDQSNAWGTRTTWERLLATAPEADAILVTNDRDEMVPLFYLQAVEARGQGYTGLFPLIAPELRFADVGATVGTALAEGGGRPVYLITEMPGLEIRFDLEPAPDADSTWVQVTGMVEAAPQHWVNQPVGPLTLLGYDWDIRPESVVIRLAWRVDAPVAGDYTATAQLMDGQRNLIAQHDIPMGGVYYPSSLWKQGEVVAAHHVLQVDSAQLPSPVTLLVGMYHPRDFAQLGAPLEILIEP
jgi:hypothetical protein